MKYTILKKKKKIYWTPNNIVGSVILICSIPPGIKYFIFKDLNYQIWDKTLVLIMIATLFCGFIYSFFKFNGYRTLKGELEGKLEFLSDKIFIDKDVFEIPTIKKIELCSYDYKGRFAWFKGNLDGNKSNGTRNFLNIFLNDGEIVKTYFQILHQNDILDERETLIKYCNDGKMNYLNLLDNLNLTDYKEIQEFKRSNLKQFQ